MTEAPAAGSESIAAGEPPDGSPAESPSDVDRTERRTRRARLAALVRHPVFLAALFPAVVAVSNGWWIWTHRHLGGYDPDEMSYLSAALRIQRSIDFGHPFEFVRTTLGTGNGMVGPLVSLPLLILGPRDPRMAMMAQPIFLLVIAIATAGIARRLAGPVTAVVAAAVVSLLPTVATATQSYWYGLPAAACFALALWALLESEGGSNRRIWWFGLAVGAMCLSRTMTLGYLPACAAAAAVVSWGDRRRFRRAVGAMCLAVAVAAPWYLSNLGSIFEYLFTYGYGPRAELFGKAGLGDRIGLRWDRMADGVAVQQIAHVAASVAFDAAIVGVVLTVVLRPSARRHLRAWSALFAAVAVGLVALVSTANNGVWFELPLVVASVPLLAAPIAWMPKPVAAPIGLFAVAALVPNQVAALWLVPFHDPGPPSHYEWGFAQYDERFTPMRRDEHASAAAEWWHLATSIERVLRCIAPDGRSAVFTVSGNTQLFNAGDVRMAAEMDGWNAELWIPETNKAPRRRAGDLTPTVRMEADRVSERVLVIGVHDQILWPSDTQVRPFLDQARRLGFREVDRFRMPRGGSVLILRHPDGIRANTNAAAAACTGPGLPTMTPSR